MSKKQKHQSRYTPSENAATPRPINIAASRPISSPFSAEFKPDYAYVIKDLKRIGVLVTSFVVILVALSFVLR
ncbi:MAG: hypothetical protein ABSA51_10185 [Anaerolineaceae bacterium]|jgi:hypothetical protein